MHHDAQKLTITGFPFSDSSDRSPPAASSRLSVKAGAARVLALGERVGRAAAVPNASFQTSSASKPTTAAIAIT